MDYGFFLSKIGKKRTPSALRDLFDAVGADPSYILLAGGLPNPDVFAIKSAVLKLTDGSELTVDESETKVALQYGRTYGLPELHAFVEELTKRLHDPPTWRNPGASDAIKTMMTAGAQDGIYKTLECLVDEGDVVLTTDPVYAAFMSCLLPYGAIIEPVKTDKDGIIPETLQAVLSKYPKQSGSDVSPTRKIKLLYCVPNGDNPTGIRYTVERKREIYRLAQEYNFLILEDDAYYFLEKRIRKPQVERRRRERMNQSIDQLKDLVADTIKHNPLTPSFLSMDVDGRVLRLDTFSKTVGPGFRVGYLTGPAPIVQRILCVAQVSSQGCSSISQVILWNLCRNWGVDGFLQHCDKVFDFYNKRRSMCLEMAQKYIADIAEWTPPSGGMFLWVKFRDIEDATPLVLQRLFNKKVLTFAGASFYATAGAKSPYVRISFSMASREQMEKGFQIIAEEAKKYAVEEKKGAVNHVGVFRDI